MHWRQVARLGVSHTLRRYGLDHVILPPLDHAKDLMEALEEAHRDNLEPLLTIARLHTYRA